jgi:hypothetical protein
MQTGVSASNAAAKKTHKTLDLTGYFWGFDSRKRFSGDENRLLRH